MVSLRFIHFRYRDSELVLTLINVLVFSGSKLFSKDLMILMDLQNF